MLARVLSLLIVLGLCAHAIPSLGEEESAPSGVRMICLNVGKGDAILLSVENRHYLVDTGYKRTWKAVRSMLEKEGVRCLDGVFITHPHKDHIGGLEKLLQSGIQVDMIYAPALSQEASGSAHPAAAAAAKAGKHVRFVKAGELIPASTSSYFEILGPITLNTDNENNNSLIMQLFTPDGSILLTGDMKAEEEFSLLRAGVLSQAEVLKVPFHGDGSASTSAFLRAVRPRVSVISTSSKEEKNTPDKDVLYRLASIGSEIYVTQDAPYAVAVLLKNRKITVRMLSK